MPWKLRKIKVNRKINIYSFRTNQPVSNGVQITARSYPKIDEIQTERTEMPLTERITPLRMLYKIVQNTFGGIQNKM